MLIAPVRVRPFADGSIGSCNAGASPGASCPRARWARQSATHWANGSHCRFISAKPKSKSIITWLRTRSGQLLLEKIMNSPELGKVAHAEHIFAEVLRDRCEVLKAA